MKYRKLTHRPWPVTVTFHECDETTGEVREVEQSFIGHFTPFTEADLLEHRSAVFGDEADKAVKARLDDMPVADYAALEAGFFTRLMCGWSAVTDEQDAPLAYTAEQLRALCCGPDGAAFRRGINRAVSEIRFGVAPAKNSSTSPVPGPTPASGEVALTN